MGSGNLVKVIEYDNQQRLIVEDMSCIGEEYRAMTVDPVGIGCGKTIEEAVRSLAKNLRKIADQIEGAI